jgi:hypothetical protein
MKILGGCFCGHVRYELLDKPMFINCCHCTDCQNQTGGAFVINAIIEAKNIKKLKGSLSRISMFPKGHRPHDIYRCKKCKIAVWSDYGRRKKMLFVRVSTFDKPHKFKPDAHIFTRSKVPWVKIPKSMPAFKIFYDLEKQWPKKSLKRREAILGKGN